MTTSWVRNIRLAAKEAAAEELARNAPRCTGNPEILQFGGDCFCNHCAKLHAEYELKQEAAEAGMTVEAYRAHCAEYFAKLRDQFGPPEDDCPF